MRGWVLARSAARERVATHSHRVMTMRYLVVLLGFLIVVGGVVGIKWAQVSALKEAGKAAEQAGPPPLSVSTGMSQSMSWESSLRAVGSIAAAKGVAVSNDLPGVVQRIGFESGDEVKQGDVLVELESSVERAQLRTALAQQRLAAQTAARTRALVARGGVPLAQRDTDEAQLASAIAEVAGLRAQIARKVVTAPFAGKLGIRAVNLGQYLSAGTMITTLEALESVFVDFALPQQALPSVQPGMPVRVTIGGAKPIAMDGALAAVDPTVDPNTRTIQLRASVPNKDKRLRPGMFANVEVVLPGQTEVVAVPATAVVHAPYGDSVFVVAPVKDAPQPDAKQAVQRFVRLGEQRGDFVAVLQGIEAGKEVVTAGAFKLQNGARVAVNNAVKVEPRLDPQPENR